MISTDPMGMMGSGNEGTTMIKKIKIKINIHVSLSENREQLMQVK